MTQRLCPRCRTVVLIEDENILVYCSNCGAPQVRISEEMLEQAQQPVEAATAEVGSNAAVGAASVNLWRGAIQCAGLAGVLAAALTFISFVVPPVALLTMFWVIAAPIVVLGIYVAKFRPAGITAGFAARLGVLCALAILVAILGLDTVRLCLDRYVFHTAGALDDQLRTAFMQQALVMKAQLGVDAMPVLRMIEIPEYRAGLMLCGFSIVGVLYLLYAAVAGAFAGMMRVRAAARQ